MRRGILGAMIGMIAMATMPNNQPYLITSPYSPFGSFNVGGSRSLAPGSPMYFPRKHTVETYRSQQRRAKRR
jgi:hypothetical protein